MPTATTNGHYDKPIIGSETDWGETLNENLDTLDTMHEEHDTDREAFNTNATLVAGTHNASTPAAAVALISNEIQQSRFSLATLQAFLGVGHNADGTNIASSYSFSQFEAGGIAVNPVYVSATTFKFSGVDYTALLPPGIVLKLAYSGATGTLYFRVKDATYSTDTTVTVWSSDPAVVNQAALGETITATLGPVKPSFLIDSAYLRGSAVANYIEYMAQSNCDFYYYSAAVYTSPFTVDADRAKTNSGDPARFEFGSGMKVGITYTAAGGNVSTIVFKHSIGGVDTTFATLTMAYDGTTGLVTDADWS